MDFYKVPIGFGLALSMNPPAMNAYSAMTEEEKEKILDKAHHVRSEKEMHGLVNSLAAIREKSGRGGNLCLFACLCVMICKKEGVSMIRKASAADLDGIVAVYNQIHTAEEKGQSTTGWVRSIYPKRETAAAAVERGDMFIQTDEAGRVVGTAILNQQQVDVYAGAPWEYDVPEDQVMVLHTLVIDPQVKGNGYGRKFVQFYEQYALENGCHYLRMDTNERNKAARAFYKKLGFREIAVYPCAFNGIPDVKLVLLEKKV